MQFSSFVGDSSLLHKYWHIRRDRSLVPASVSFCLLCGHPTMHSCFVVICMNILRGFTLHIHCWHFCLHLNVLEYSSFLYADELDVLIQWWVWEEKYQKRNHHAGYVGNIVAFQSKVGKGYSGKVPNEDTCKRKLHNYVPPLNRFHPFYVKSAPNSNPYHSHVKRRWCWTRSRLLKVNIGSMG